MDTFYYHEYTDIVSSGDYVTLDQDNRAGIVSDCSASGGASHGKCGPETITISKLRSGTYRYHVHVWSQKGNDTAHIGDNGTYVQVFYDIDKSKTFYAPKRNGDVWTVFDYALSDNFTLVNTMDSKGTGGNVDNIQ